MPSPSPLPGTSHRPRSRRPSCIPGCSQTGPTTFPNAAFAADTERAAAYDERSWPSASTPPSRTPSGFSRPALPEAPRSSPTRSSRSSTSRPQTVPAQRRQGPTTTAPGSSTPPPMNSASASPAASGSPTCSHQPATWRRRPRGRAPASPRQDPSGQARGSGLLAPQTGWCGPHHAPASSGPPSRSRRRGERPNYPPRPGVNTPAAASSPARRARRGHGGHHPQPAGGVRCQPVWAPPRPEYMTPDGVSDADR